VLLAFTLATAIDWLWDLTVVAVVGIVCAGLLVSRATLFGSAAIEPPPSIGAARGRLGLRALAVTAALVLVAAQAVPLLTERRIEDSQDELKSGDADAALDAANDATDVQPWASSAHLQIALVHEYAKQFDEARAAIDRAIDRDESDWQLWVVASRIAQQSGEMATARQDYDRARALNPRSSYFDEAKRP
jgi:tetratricopeptide (TPR) repeat protein